MSVATETETIESLGALLNGDEDTPATAPDPEPEASTGADVQFDFEEDFQRRIVALMLRDPKFMRRTEGLIRPEYFDNQSQAFLADMVNSYYDKYRRIPRGKAIVAELLKQGFIDKRVRDELRRAIIDEYKEIVRTSLEDGDYICDRVGHFARHQAVLRANIEQMKLIDKGRLDDAQKVMEKAYRVGSLDDFQEIDYWNDIGARTQYRKDMAAGLIKPNGITTGINKIDRLLYHKGWGRKELSVIMGGAKKGKSMGLGFFSVKASMAGYNVLYVTLEVAGEIIADRNDANVSGTDMDQLEHRIHDVESGVRAASAYEGLGTFKIVSYPASSFTPKALRRVLERYRADGVVFDLIVVDYADNMAPDNYTDSPIENSKQVWLGLRSIAHEEDAAVLTATQTNRDGFKKDTARAEDAAEDFNKIRIADIVISINRSDEETQNGEARLFFAASRNQQGEISLRIKQDLSKMRFITSVSGTV